MFQIGKTGACQLPLDRDNPAPCWFSQLRKPTMSPVMVTPGGRIKDDRSCGFS
jgi:hypothetical protein